MLPRDAAMAPDDNIGSVRLKGAAALDNVQTDELQHLGFERALRKELLHVHEQRSWTHVAGPTPFVRYCKYWLGVLGPTRYSTPYIQPMNNVLDHLSSTYFSPNIFFSAIFAQMVVSQALTQPNSVELGASWAWLASSCLYSLAGPMALVDVPILMVQNHALAAVPRDRLRGLLAEYKTCIGMTHGVSINIFQLFFLASGLRLYAIYSTSAAYSDFATALVMGFYSLGLGIVLACAWPTVRLYFAVWQLWEQCAQAVTDGHAQVVHGEDAHSSTISCSNAEYGPWVNGAAGDGGGVPKVAAGHGGRALPAARPASGTHHAVGAALEEGGLSEYEQAFCSKGYDLLSDLREMAAAADQSAFEEAVAAVGMGEKPGHVWRLRKVLLHSE